MSALLFRPAREADLDRLVEVHGSAFPDARGVRERLHNFTANPLGPLGDLHVAERDGGVVGHAFLFDLGVAFGGAVVRTAGVATVGVAPEARRSGVAGALLRHLHELAARRGAALSLLYAFRERFYARLGYAKVASRQRLSLAPEAVPAAWVDEARRAELCAVEEQDREAVMACYARAALRHTGWLVRPAALWNARFLGERSRVVVLRRGEIVAGYIRFALAQAEAHAATQLVVHELVADDDPARRALLGFLGQQADQAAQVELEVDARDPLPFALLDADARRHGTEQVEHAVGLVVAGPMLRVLDVPRALEARGYDAAGEAAFALEDGGAFRLRVAEGRARVTACPRGETAVRTTAAALTQIAFGGLGVRAAERLGLVSGDATALDTLDALLALPPFFALDKF